MTTVNDLMGLEGQAELIGGRIVWLPFHGYLPGKVIGNVFMSLREYEVETELGMAASSTLIYEIPKIPSGRESFCPDASYYTGPLPVNRMSHILGPPAFAVEVRGEHDFTTSANTQFAAKRDDYYVAGTLVVWDVDPLAQTVTCYRADDPAHPVTWRRGDTAEAEPAVPGWRMAVDEIFA